MNTHDIEKAVSGLPHIEALAVILASAQAAAGCGLWPRPPMTAEAAASYAEAREVYRAAVQEATTRLRAVTQSIQSTFASPDFKQAHD